MRSIRVAMALALLFIACNRTNHHDSLLSQNRTDFGGRWSFSRQTTGSTCTGQAVSGIVGSGYLDIAQTGDSLTVMDLDLCGTFVYGGAGTVNGTVAVIEADYGGCANSSCCYAEHFTETVTLSGNTLSGDMRFTVTDTGCGNNTGTPCDYMGTITATWCPPGTCRSYPSSCM